MNTNKSAQIIIMPVLLADDNIKSSLLLVTMSGDRPVLNLLINSWCLV